ncbi:phage portal protein [Cohnella nanjingensis]|uniref:Phage portal protein n=2 Tax=Cohnella nanjingensis TaxID=1387779 RepID=A0A7X0VDS4_9BACL|nr:phage portal protein [Cohnella nanjingensis]
MRLEQIIQLEIDDWRKSPELKLIQLGKEYYRVEHAIKDRKREIIGDGGRMVEDKNLANKKLIHAFIRKLVDQKVGYLLSKQPSIQTKNKNYADAIGGLFNKAFLRILQNVGKNAINGGRGWLHPHYNDAGELTFKVIPTEEGIPIWRDAAHTELEAFIRVYKQDYYEGTTKHVLEKVEYWDESGVKRFVLNAPGSAGLTPDEDAGAVSAHFVAQEDEAEQPLNWERVPFICFKYNDEEQPLIKFLKSLVDDYDEQTSDNSNNLTDLPNGIYVLKEYDGTDLGEFRRNLSRYRAVKVSGEGGVETLTLQFSPEALKQHIDQLRKDIYEFGRGVDSQSDKFGNSPSGIALRFLYSDLDMDANIIETEFQASLEQLLWFVNTHLANTGAGDFFDESVDIVFNRDILINETDTISNAKNSVGLISDETIVANHPWVTDTQEELERLKREREASLADYGALGQPQGDKSGSDPNGTDGG